MPSQLEPSFRISAAEPADTEDMVNLVILAMEYEVIIRFMFSERHEESMRLQQDFWTALWTKAFGSKATHVMKATSTSTGDLVGFGLIRWEDAKWEKPSAASPSPDAPPATNDGFLAFYGAEQNQNYRRLMVGQRHYVWGSLYVSPDYQRKGIGSAILRWGFDKYGLDKEVVFVQTIMGSRGMYERYGWVEVDATEVDLAEWGGKDRGFGLHRSPQMIRQPGPFVRRQILDNELTQG